jgi:hypothetical protein
MIEFSHRVRVFVFTRQETRPQYLLLRSGLGIESFWTPLHGRIGFGEQLETAVTRGVMHQTGIQRPEELIDLDLTSSLLLGDEQVVEWSYGFRAPREALEVLHLDDRWAAHRWAEMEQAFSALELEADRAALVRLHTRLHE